MENDDLKNESNNANTLLCTDWREVAKEKPQDKQYVIVYALGGRMLMAYYKNEIFFCYDIASEELEEIEEPTHWMPQPPKPICA